MAFISIDNGMNFSRASGVSKDLDRIWSQVVNVMDDDIREEVHTKFAPCSNRKFLSEYLKRAKDDIVIG